MNRKLKLAAAVVAGVLGAGVLAAPAHATVAQGYITGTGSPTDDWNDEGPLSSSHYADSYATGVWQWVLYADGATESNGTPFDFADIDFDFGPNTTYATKSWQRSHGLTVDGIVGPNTLSTADKKLSLATDIANFVYYNGSKHRVGFYRDSLNGISGVYSVESNLGYGCFYYAAYSDANPFC